MWSKLWAVVGLLVSAVAATGQASEATLDWSVLAYNDGRHNAFTDLAQWRGHYYLVFRNGIRHVDFHNDMGKIFVMRSKDLRDWQLISVISTADDDRDPKLAVLEDRLYCFFGTWQSPGGDHVRWVRSHVSWTVDGLHWSTPEPIYKPGFWLWRPRVHEGMFYGVAYTATRPTPARRESRLVQSASALVWEEITTLSKKRMMGEADILWRNAKDIWIVSRAGDEKGNAAWFRSLGDLTRWSVDNDALDDAMHSPVMVQWKDRVFLAGRGGKKNAWNTSIWELKEGEAEKLITLPSSGRDTAYPGLLVDPQSLDADTPALFVSWYSQHEKGKYPHDTEHASNIYVGRVVVK